MSDKLSATRIHSIKIRGVLFSAKRAEDGQWERDGEPMPWLCITPWVGHGGTSLRVGPWMFGIMWEKRDAI